MSRRLALVLATAAALAAASLPALAQGAGVRPARGARAHSGPPQVRFNPPATPSFHRGFGPGFGHFPNLHQRFPVFGLGFDAHHFHVLNHFRSLNADFHVGFFGGGFFGQGTFVGGGFFPVVSAPTVVVVPQPQIVPVVVQAAVPLPQEEIIVPVGLPENWGQVRFVRPSYTAESTPLHQLTLIVLKDETILAVTDYWLEDLRIFFLTSAGAQGSVALRNLDWEMTTRLNSERRVPFILREGR